MARKPSPALIIRSDFLAETDNVLVCLLTSTLRAAPLFRPSLGEATGLREQSQVMVDKIMAVHRDRCGEPLGRADDPAMLALGRRLAFVVGVAD